VTYRQNLILEGNMAEFQGIIRVAGKDVKGELNIARALTQIKGIGINLSETLSKIIEKKLGIPMSSKIGELEHEQIKKIEELILQPEKQGIPGWALNRKGESGEDLHLLGAERDFQVSQDISKQKKIKSYRGMRHMFGFKCRGQRTRGSAKTGRKGKAVGVVRKKQQPQKKKGAGGDKGGKKK